MCKEQSIKLQNGELKLELAMQGFSEERATKIWAYIMKEYMYELTGVTEEDAEAKRKSTDDLIREAYAQTFQSSDVRVEGEANQGADSSHDSMKEDVPLEEPIIQQLKGSSYRKVDNQYKFQVFYKCPACGLKKRIYVPRQMYIKCSDCGEKMYLKPALKDAEFPHVDDWGNLYVAGLQRQQDNIKDNMNPYTFKIAHHLPLDNYESKESE